MTPIVSIIICTCNRAEHLRPTLAAIAAVCVPDAMSAELIVVDNGSTDETAEVVKQCSLPNMPVRYLKESRRGLSYARNSGMEAAQGQVILFTDDDVRPHQNWIKGMCGPILCGEADIVAGGVQFAPDLVRDWMEPLHRTWLASTEKSDPEAPAGIVGANMAFSRRVLEQIPVFDTELGSGAMGFGEETLFLWQLEKAGYRMAHRQEDLETRVEHHFEQSRLSREAFLASAKKRGQVSAYLAYHWDHATISLPLLHLWKCRLRLSLSRIRRHQECSRSEGAAVWEMQQVQIMHFYAQYRKERHRPRNYEKQGLVKLSSI